MQTLKHGSYVDSTESKAKGTSDRQEVARGTRTDTGARTEGSEIDPHVCGPWHLTQVQRQSNEGAGTTGFHVDEHEVGPPHHAVYKNQLKMGQV